MKAALISGSSSGIGKAISEKFLETGIKVIGLARDHSKFKPDEKNYIPIEADLSKVKRLPELMKRNANIIAYLYPPGFSSDTSSFTSPDPDGAAAKLSMRNALKDNDVAFVNAHGTSTPVGDEIEYNAIKEVLGNVPIVSNKSKIGHTMGACGIIEAIYTIKSLQSGQIPDNHNITKCSFDTDGMITNKNRTTTGKMALNNSFGFGGKCASQLIEIV